jgi:hypothetical protein
MEERRYVYTSADKEADEMESRARTIMEIRDLADRIAMMDETEEEKLRPMLESLTADTQFPDRLANLRKQLKTKWGTLRDRAVSTAFYREQLSSLLDLLQTTKNTSAQGEAAELERRCRTLHGGKFIDRALFTALYEDVMSFVWGRAEEIADHILVQKAEQTLAEMGYELLTDEADAAIALTPGQVHYLETPYDGYRVMVKADKGELSTRLVRVTDMENEALSPDQRQKDIETGKKWCHDLDKFFEKMKEQGISLDVALRKEPEEVELMTVVDPNMRTRKKKRRKGSEAGKLQEVAAR